VSDQRTNPHRADLSAWLRLQGTERPDMDPAEAEWCGMLRLAAAEIDLLRAFAHKVAEMFEGRPLGGEAREALGAPPLEKQHPYAAPTTQKPATASRAGGG
jgi:hypothetical protein